MVDSLAFGPIVEDRTDQIKGAIEPKWFFTKEQLMRSPSIQAGMSYENEQNLLRQAAAFVRLLATRMNEVPNTNKLSQLSVSVAIVQTRRFFLINRLNGHDPRDVASVALFLSSKSEECPRRLEHFVLAFYRLKVELECPKEEWDINSRLEKKLYEQLCDYFAWIENLILQTIGFDFNVQVPHPNVINMSQMLFIDSKGITEVGFWFATDSLHMTDWCVRYTPVQVAVIVIFLICCWAKIDIPYADVEVAEGEFVKKKFYEKFGDGLTEDELLELVKEHTLTMQHLDEKNLLAVNKYKHMVAELKQTCIPTYSSASSSSTPQNQNQCPIPEREPGEI